MHYHSIHHLQHLETFLGKRVHILSKGEPSGFHAYLDDVHTTSDGASLTLTRPYSNEPYTLHIDKTDISFFHISEDFGIYAERLCTQSIYNQLPPPQHITSFQKFVGELQRAYELGLDITLESVARPHQPQSVITLGEPVELIFTLSSVKLVIKEPFSSAPTTHVFAGPQLLLDPILINFLRHKDTNAN